MTVAIPTLNELEVDDKLVLVRVDFNVPMSGKRITDDTRIRGAIPTIQALRERGARVILCSHLGRPRGQRNQGLSLLPVAARLAELLDDEVIFSHDTTGHEVAQLARELPPKGVMVLENLRFDAREKAGDKGLGKELADLADLFVNDAFGTMHRKHASITEVPKHLPSASGLLVTKELAVLDGLINTEGATKRAPFAAILGGAKVSDKMSIIDALSKRLDHVFIGGAMAYTFLKVQGVAIGDSRVEEDHLELAEKLLALCANRGVKVHLPIDHIVTDEFSETAAPQAVTDIPDGDMGLDIGPNTLKAWTEILERCNTVFWNGPMGVFEWDSFAGGTRGIAETLAATNAMVVVGGGDSAAAVAKFGLGDKMNHISTGGGASLDYLENGNLVGLTALRNS